MSHCVCCFFHLLVQRAWAWFCGIDFNNAFLSDIAAFEGAAIGIALPLAWDTISRSAEKYGDVVISKFQEHLATRLLLPSFVAHILLTIGTRLISTDANLANPGSKVWGAMLFVWFVANLLLFVQYLRLLHTYTFNIRAIVERLFEDARDSIRSS